MKKNPPTPQAVSKRSTYKPPKEAPKLAGAITIDEAIERMKAFPGLRMTMEHHYRGFEYNYWDTKTQTFLTESGDRWHIATSRSQNELTGYADWKES